jgi:MFS family permease
MNGKSTAAVDVPVVSHRPMKILVAILILDLVAFAVILPLFPSLLEYYEQHDATVRIAGVALFLKHGWFLQDALYVRTRTLIRRVAELTGAPERVDAVLVGGALGSVFSALQFVSSPMFGALSDVFGRRRTLLVATVRVHGHFIAILYFTVGHTSVVRAVV